MHYFKRIFDLIKIKFISELVEPTAATALSPTNTPKTATSTVLNKLCKILVNTIGIEKIIIWLILVYAILEESIHRNAILGRRVSWNLKMQLMILNYI